MDKPPMPKTILPPPTPLSYRAPRDLLLKEIEFFLPNAKGTNRLKAKIVRSLDEGWLVWTGSAFFEIGLQFRKQPVRTVEELLFAKPIDDRNCPTRPRKKSLAYMDAELAKVGLRIGQAIPPNDYD